MLKHALKTALEIDRLPPEKRMSVAVVNIRRRSSVFNNGQIAKRNLRRSSSLSWPNSRSSNEFDERYYWSKIFHGHGKVLERLLVDILLLKLDTVTGENNEITVLAAVAEVPHVYIFSITIPRLRNIFDLYF
ncbi:hypothetical protein NQ318_015233 [Aromia moschata]|uniref:Uncharacterized protein n=1 Tax=Aromia moschata TaxID=1265417 RepID=A0AAV8X838_9CUCU|nr:hypothetical protein NQ318_015233 [Aromia moschata]